MPRTSAIESPGCPPLRALTTDVLGLIKVVEARGNARVPKVVDTWGPPDASRGILAASFADHETQPLIAVARKDNLVEILNPLNGHVLAATKVGESSSLGQPYEDDPIVGLHFLNTKRIDLSSRSNVLLMCTEKGKAILRTIPTADASPDNTADSQSTWDVCAAGKVICSSVNANEKYALFGGKGIEMNVWDLHNCSKTWTAKPPPCNSLNIFSPTWFNAATFLSKEDHHKIVAGTNNHQIRLYDILAQRRPVASFSFREVPIKAVTTDLDGHTVYMGSGSGDLASFDMRTGKLLGCFVGKCSGSIRSLTRHPELPILASCGLDSYLRIWDTKTRQLLSAVFLKQHLTNVLIDSLFYDGECICESAEHPRDLQECVQTGEEEEQEKKELLLSMKSSNKAKKKENKEKSKVKNSNKSIVEDNQLLEEDHTLSLGEDGTDKLTPPKRRKPSSAGKGRSKGIKKSKSNEP